MHLAGKGPATVGDDLWITFHPFGWDWLLMSHIRPKVFNVR
jgi:hypothetical protein